MRQSLTAAGLVSVPLLEDLYGWHGGTALPDSGLVDDLEIVPALRLLGVDDAVAERTWYLEHGAWEAGWFPILTDGGGLFYLVDLGSGDDPVVRRWEFDDPGGHVAFGSLSAFVATIDEAYGRGIVFVGPRGYLEMDDTWFADLAVELNPAASAAWRRDDEWTGDVPRHRQPPEHLG